MSSTRIRTRTTGTGAKRYMVCYRLGGRYSREQSAGTFDKLTHARQRLTAVQGLIARGEHDQITRLANPAPAEPAVRSWPALHRRWLDGTHNLKPSSRLVYEQHGRALATVIGHRDPTQLSWQDCRDLVTALVQQGLSPRTVKAYTGTLKLVLDFAGLEPNPARDRRVKLPASQPNNPTSPHAPTSKRSAPTSQPSCCCPSTCLRQPA
ncbi:MAG: hypothetical protein OXG37_00290 [Actinomycetia bacterium]|nr:hypothetical protein [Actinomycetes bacterium]